MEYVNGGEEVKKEGLEWGVTCYRKQESSEFLLSWRKKWWEALQSRIWRWAELPQWFFFSIYLLFWELEEAEGFTRSQAQIFRLLSTIVNGKEEALPIEMDFWSGRRWMMPGGSVSFPYIFLGEIS